MVDGAPDVLLVRPRVEDAERQQVADRAVPGRGPRLGVEVGAGEAAQLREPRTRDLAELVEHLRAGPPASRVDPHLVALPDLVLDVVVVGRRVVGCGPSEDARLDAGDVHHVVLHAPAGQVRGRLPLCLAEVGAHRIDRRPHLLEAVHKVLVVRRRVGHDPILPADATTL